MKKHRFERTYYCNGTLSWEYKLIDDKIYGPEKAFHQNGSPMWITFVIGDLNEGEYIRYKY